MSARILIVEDEPAIVKMLSSALERSGYQVKSARDGRSALQQLKNTPFDLIILDIAMPRMDGWEALRRIRAISNVPVIMLTGQDADQDQVRGLETGADDYITKPASIAVIRARVRATLRRDRQPQHLAEEVLHFNNGHLVVHPGSGEVLVNGQPAELTPTEHRLLLYLIANAGQVRPHQEVLAAVWGPDYRDPEVLKLFISRLRKKIESDPAHPHYIKTQRGFGYYFAAEKE